MDRSFDARLREIPPAAFHAILARMSEIDECRGWWKGRDVPPPSVLGRLKRRVIDVSAGVSTRIDGRGLSPAEVQRLLRGSRIGKPEERDAPAIAGYAELLRSVFDRHGEMSFGTDLILQLHARLFKYSTRDHGHRGAYKTAPDKVTAYLRRETESVALRPADPHLTPRAMRAATDWAAARLASSEFHPLLVIAGFVLEFLAIRPFADGNGRLSRVLTNLLLLRSGYAYVPYASLEKAIADRRTEYYLALRRSQAFRNLPRPDISSWLVAFLDALRAQARELRETLDGRPSEKLLSENQLAVLDLLGRHRELTTRLLRRELGLPRETAKQVLGRLVALNLLQRAGAGRAVRYRKAPVQEAGAEAR